MKKPNSRTSALDAALASIRKSFGDGSLMRLGDSQALSVEAISTGSVGLDLALGVGGYPKGRIVEIFGPESSGKSTLALHAVAQAQRAGGEVAYIDAEHALDPTYAARLGVRIGDLLISQPSSGEEALTIADRLIQSGAISLVVIDSVAALVPQKELDGEMGDATVGAQARLMSQAMRKIAASLSRTGTIAIFINQLREKIGVMFGNPETTPGGRALKFYASIRIDLRRVETLRAGETAIGNRVRAKVVKNKVAPPFRQANFDVYFGEGISREAEILDIALEKGRIEKSGTWLSFEGEKIGQGRDNARAFLKEHPAISQKLLDRIEA